MVPVYVVGELTVPVDERRPEELTGHDGVDPVGDPGPVLGHHVERVRVPPRHQQAQRQGGRIVDEPVRRVVFLRVVLRDPRQPPGMRNSARPDSRDSDSFARLSGCHGGESRANAPALVCQANNSSREASTTLECTMPMTRP